MGSPTAYMNRRKIKMLDPEGYSDYYLFPEMDKVKDFLFFQYLASENDAYLPASILTCIIQYYDVCISGQESVLV